MYDQLVATAPSARSATKLIKALKKTFGVHVIASGTLITDEGTSVKIFGDKIAPTLLTVMQIYSEAFCDGFTKGAKEGYDD